MRNTSNGTTEYVVGFAFEPDEKHVILVRKKRPEWQKGALNGPGGHIENGEGMYEAMAREFKEETGVDTNPFVWKHKVTIEGNGWRVYFLSIKLNNKLFYSAKTVTDEMISVIPVSRLYEYTMISNLRWLIPYCLYTPDIDEKVTYMESVL